MHINTTCRKIYTKDIQNTICSVFNWLRILGHKENITLQLPHF